MLMMAVELARGCDFFYLLELCKTLHRITEFFCVTIRLIFLKKFSKQVFKICLKVNAHDNISMVPWQFLVSNSNKLCESYILLTASSKECCLIFTVLHVAPTWLVSAYHTVDYFVLARKS